MGRKYTVFQSVTIIFFLFATLFGSLPVVASEHQNEEKGVKAAEEEELEIGKMIIEHITDSYEWHILTVGEHHISIPLPVILYDGGNWYIFSSSRFHHGHSDYKGFYVSEEQGPNQGKIVRKNSLGQEVRPQLDISITKTVFAILFNSFLVILIFMSVAKSYKKREGKAPKGLQSLLEPLILFVRDDVAKSSIGEKRYETYLPFLLTLFFFIFLNNLMGIVPFFPGGANVTGNIGVTGVMAAFTFVITTVSGNKHYWTDIFNTPGVPWWLKIPVPLMPIVEVMGVFTKPIVLMIRLFANMSAGHIVILGFVSLIFIFGKVSVGLGYGVSLVSVGFSVFLDLLELLVAFIQAYVFTLLSALYFGMATAEPEHH